MKMENYFHSDNVIIDAEFDDYDRILLFVSEKLSATSGLKKEQIYTLLKRREAIGPTYIGNAVSVPHCREEGIDKIFGAFIKLKTPVTIDVYGRKESVKYVFTILTSTKKEDLYLSLLSRISKIILKHGTVLDEISSTDEFYKRLNNYTENIGKNLVAKDLILNYPVIKSSSSVLEAVDVMRNRQLIFLPVVDENNRVEGIIGVSDLIRSGFPDFVFQLHDFSFIKEFKPLTAFWEKEDQISVKSCMRNAFEHFVNQDVSYLEVLFLMAKHSRHHLIVVNSNHEYQGIISPLSILNVLLRP